MIGYIAVTLQGTFRRSMYGQAHKSGLSTRFHSPVNWVTTPGRTNPGLTRAPQTYGPLSRSIENAASCIYPLVLPMVTTTAGTERATTYLQSLSYA